MTSFASSHAPVAPRSSALRNRARAPTVSHGDRRSARRDSMVATASAHVAPRASPFIDARNARVASRYRCASCAHRGSITRTARALSHDRAANVASATAHARNDAPRFLRPIPRDSRRFARVHGVRASERESECVGCPFKMRVRVDVSLSLGYNNASVASVEAKNTRCRARRMLRSLPFCSCPWSSQPCPWRTRRCRR